jgi:hypothetical protein
MHCAHRHTKALSNRANGLTITNRTDHLLTSLWLKLFCSYLLCTKKLQL